MHPVLSITTQSLDKYRFGSLSRYQLLGYRFPHLLVQGIMTLPSSLPSTVQQWLQHLHVHHKS